MRLIHFEPGSISVALEIKAAIERGEFVGILGDRVWESERGRSVSVPFLGTPHALPARAVPAAGHARLPDAAEHVRPHGAARYAASTERFAPGLHVPRGERTKYAEALVHRYAAVLERGVSAHSLSVVQLLRLLARRGRTCESRSGRRC